MATQLKFEIFPSADKKSFYFVETTGVYDATYNPGGWGAPNDNYLTATEATLAITLADASVVSFNSASTPAFYPTFPNVTYVAFQITNEMIGLEATAEITDWIPLIVYTVDGNDGGVWQATVSSYRAVLSQSDCCVAGLAANVTVDNGCNCDNDQLQAFSDAWDLKTAIDYAVSEDCQKPNKAARILVYLQGLCNNGCGC